MLKQSMRQEKLMLSENDRESKSVLIILNSLCFLCYMFYKVTANAKLSEY